MFDPVEQLCSRNKRSTGQELCPALLRPGRCKHSNRISIQVATSIQKVDEMSSQVDKLQNYTVIARLDDAIPLNTEEWVAVERLLNQVSEFVPMSMLNNLTEAI